MIKLRVIGNYAPNLKGLPGSSYLLKGFSRPILLDLGNGNIKEVLKQIRKEKLKDVILILSHNHVDHSFDVLRLEKILKKYNIKITVYMPCRSFIYWYIKKSKNFDVKSITEKTKFSLDGYNFSFCQNFHSGECYSTKFEKDGKSFVYTSDMSYVSRGVKSFCYNAEFVLIDSGHPYNDKFSLKGYHGNTKEILDDLFDKDCRVKKVYASHLKASLKDNDYKKVFPKGKDVFLVKMNNEYDIF